jgi:ferredoxin-NADP reductase
LERLTPVEQKAPGRWQVATVKRVKRETPRVKSFLFDVPMWMPHLPGQHYDVRLTAPDGYRAQRSYSIASSPLDEGQVELTIDLLEDGRCRRTFTRWCARATRSSCAVRLRRTSASRSAA